MRKQAIIFLLIAAISLPSFGEVLVTRSMPRVAADVELEHRVMTAVHEKFHGVGMWVEAHDGNVIMHGIFAEMMSQQIASRVRRVEGVKTARWGAY